MASKNKYRASSLRMGASARRGDSSPSSPSEVLVYIPEIDPDDWSETKVKVGTGLASIESRVRFEACEGVDLGSLYWEAIVLKQDLVRIRFHNPDCCERGSISLRMRALAMPQRPRTPYLYVPAWPDEGIL